MSNISELACTYATLILHDEGIPITVEKIATLVKVANVEVESYWPSLFAKLANKKNIDDLILNVGSGGAAAPAAMATPAGGVQGTASPSAAVDEKTKEELNEEGDDDDGLGFSLFDD